MVSAVLTRTESNPKPASSDLFGDVPRNLTGLCRLAHCPNRGLIERAPHPLDGALSLPRGASAADVSPLHYLGIDVHIVFDTINPDWRNLCRFQDGDNRAVIDRIYVVLLKGTGDKASQSRGATHGSDERPNDRAKGCREAASPSAVSRRELCAIFVIIHNESTYSFNSRICSEFVGSFP